MPCDQRKVMTEPNNWITSGITLSRTGLRSTDVVDKLKREVKLVVNTTFYVYCILVSPPYGPEKNENVGL